MSYRKQIDTTEELAAWYDSKYKSMGGCWNTPADECNKHLDDLGVPFNRRKFLLDVGCGGGHFLEQANKRVKCMGIEISVEAQAECARRMNRVAVPVMLLAIDDLPYDNWVVDYITAIGSLEHVIDLPKALEQIRSMLTKKGKWYFYVPNELWSHSDQPNERTHTDEEWVRIFMDGGLEMEDHRRWNDSTAFWGRARL